MAQVDERGGTTHPVRPVDDTSSPALAAPVRQILNYVGGRFVQGDTGFDDVNPVDDSVIAHVHEAGAGLVDQAVRSARSALAGPYGRSTAAERVRMLRTAADVIERRFDELVDAEVGDTASAGGHLALWAAAAAPAPGLVGTVALAPVADLGAADRAALGDGAVRDFLGGSPDGRPDLDPVRLNTPDTPVLIVHGERDAIVPVAQAHRYRQAHPRTEIDVVPGAAHFSLIDPLGPAWKTVRDRLLTMT